MSKLPFIVSGILQRTEKITDSMGISIEIPRYGSLTWQEFQVWAALNLTLQNETATMTQYSLSLVCALLRFRFKLDEKTTDEEIMDIQGHPMTESMMMDILDFFLKEQARWVESVPDEKKKEVKVEAEKK